MLFKDLRFERDEARQRVVSQRISREDFTWAIVGQNDDGVIAARINECAIQAFENEARLDEAGGFKPFPGGSAVIKFADTFELSHWLEQYHDVPGHSAPVLRDAFISECQAIAMGGRVLKTLMTPDWGHLYCAIACTRSGPSEYHYAVRFMKDWSGHPDLANVAVTAGVRNDILANKSAARRTVLLNHLRKHLIREVPDLQRWAYEVTGVSEGLQPNRLQGITKDEADALMAETHTRLATEKAAWEAAQAKRIPAGITSVGRV